MADHIDIQNHRDGGDDYLKPDRLMTRHETAREFIDSEGGIRVEMTDSEIRFRYTPRLEPTFWPDYGISGPHRLKTPGPSIGTVLLAALVMAVTLAVVWLRVYP